MAYPDKHWDRLPMTLPDWKDIRQSSVARSPIRPFADTQNLFPSTLSAARGGELVREPSATIALLTLSATAFGPAFSIEAKAEQAVEAAVAAGTDPF